MEKETREKGRKEGKGTGSGESGIQISAHTAIYLLCMLPGDNEGKTVASVLSADDRDPVATFPEADGEDARADLPVVLQNGRPLGEGVLRFRPSVLHRQLDLPAYRLQVRRERPDDPRPFHESLRLMPEQGGHRPRVRVKSCWEVCVQESHRLLCLGGENEKREGGTGVEEKDVPLLPLLSGPEIPRVPVRPRLSRNLAGGVGEGRGSPAVTPVSVASAPRVDLSPLFPGLPILQEGGT